MSQKAFLGIDIGTTATKVLLIDSAGNILAQVERTCQLHSSYPGWAEEDTGQWWQNVCRAVPECLAAAGLESRQVVAVGVSGMVPALVAIDEWGNVLRPSIQQNDARATCEIEYFQAATKREEILKRTGSAITQQSIGPKLLWLKRNEPQIFSSIAYVMGSYDFINYRLTGKHTIERNWALESGLFDLQQDDWTDELLQLAGISRHQLGAVHWPAEIIGGISSAAAVLTGLQTGTPVVAGCADHIASAFSAGLKQPGDMLIKLGGSGDILFCMGDVLIDQRLYLDYHVIPGKYLLNGCMAASGSLIKWFNQEIAADMSLAELDELASAIPAGAGGLVLLPYFLGEKTPLHDPYARGTLVGLTLSHTKAHIYRAVLEGISFGFYHHLMVFDELGLEVTRSRVTNGGARSALWKQITSDVLGVRLEQIAHHPGSSLGAAFIAGMGGGEFSSWDQIDRFVKVSDVVEPDPARHTVYMEKYQLYREIYEALKDKYPRFA